MRTLMLFFLGVVLLAVSCKDKQEPPSDASALDFTPRESKYQDVTPTTLSIYIDFDGSNFSVVDSKLGNVKPTDFDIKVDGPFVNSGKLRLFEINLFDNLGQLVATDLVTAAATMRTNFPDSDNKTVLHQEEALSRITFPYTIKFDRERIPAKFTIREVSVSKGEVVPVNRQDTLRHVLTLDSLKLKKFKR